MSSCFRTFIMTSAGGRNRAVWRVASGEWLIVKRWSCSIMLTRRCISPLEQRSRREKPALQVSMHVPYTWHDFSPCFILSR